MTFWWLVHNEIVKMLRKRRFQVVIGIVIVLMIGFAYAEHRASVKLSAQLGTSDWRVHLQQQINNQQNHLHSPFLSDGQKAAIQAQISVSEYELNHNLNPLAPGAPSFLRTFMDEGILLLIPLFVVVIASDMVSSEVSGGTIKMLLTRGVSRADVLTSKLIALFFMIAMLLFTIAVAAYAVSGLFFGYQGFGLPIPMGFSTSTNGTVDISNVYTVPQWQYLLMTCGFAFLSCLCVASLSFLASVLFKSTASSMGVMMAALIAGTLLVSLASGFTEAKYLPMVNLQLSGYLNGSPPPVEGMTFPFSLLILGVWTTLAILLSYVVFTKRDVNG